MPTPTTLVQFWQQERDVYDNQVSKAQTKFGTAQAALIQANKDLTDEQKNFSKISDDIAAKREKLKATTIPADANALVIEIRDLIIQQRTSQGKLLDLKDDVDTAQSKIDSASSAGTRAAARLAEAEAKLATAKDENKTRQAGKAAVASPPLSTLKADATAAQTGPAQTAATTKIGDIPADVRTIANGRHVLRNKQLADARAAVDTAEDALAKERNDNGGLAGVAAKKGIEFRRAERKLIDYVTTAKASFDRALGLFNRVGADPVLTPPQKADATSFNSGGTGTTAEGNAATVVADQGTVDGDRNALETTTFTKQIADIDSDVSTNADVVTATNKLKGDLNTLKDDSTTNYPDKATLDQWQAIIPDAAWQKLLDYEEATAILTEVAGINAATIVTEMDTAESAYAGALYAAAQSQRRVEYIQDVTSRRATRAKGIAAALSTRLLSAIRGDSF